MRSFRYIEKISRTLAASSALITSLGLVPVRSTSYPSTGCPAEASVDPSCRARAVHDPVFDNSSRSSREARDLFRPFRFALPTKHGQPQQFGHLLTLHCRRQRITCHPLPQSLTLQAQRAEPNGSLRVTYANATMRFPKNDRAGRFREFGRGRINHSSLGSPKIFSAREIVGCVSRVGVRHLLQSAASFGRRSWSNRSELRSLGCSRFKAVESPKRFSLSRAVESTAACQSLRSGSMTRRKRLRGRCVHAQNVINEHTRIWLFRKGLIKANAKPKAIGSAPR